MFGGAFRDFGAVVDDDDVVADFFDFGEDVCGEEDGFGLAEVFDEAAHAGDLGGVESFGGFIEDEDGWIVEEGLCETGALFVAFGELADRAFDDLLEAAEVDELVDALFALGAGHGVEAAGEVELFIDAHFGVEWV